MLHKDGILGVVTCPQFVKNGLAHLQTLDKKVFI